jgi:hypothetical protein
VETKFERVGDAMAYLENENVADVFNTTEGHAIAAYHSAEEPGAAPVATIYEGVDGVTVEYRS